MSRTVSVFIRRDAQPVFPDRCVVCDGVHPEHRATLFAAEMRSGHSFVGGAYSFKVPCCVRCALRLHVSRVLIGWAPLLIVGAGLALLIYLQPMTKAAGPISWFAGALGVVALVILRGAFPQRIAVEPRDDLVSFEFRDPDLAAEFRQLNPGN